jgi:hypothetical protein
VDANSFEQSGGFDDHEGMFAQIEKPEQTSSSLKNYGSVPRVLL